MFRELVRFVFELFTGPDFGGQSNSVLDAYDSAWRERKRSGNESESVLASALLRFGVPDDELESYADLFEFWNEGLTPRSVRSIVT